MQFWSKKDIKKQNYINKYITIVQVKHEKDKDNYYTLYLNTLAGICKKVNLNKKKASIVIENKVGYWKVSSKVYINTGNVLKIVKSNAFSK